MPGSNPSSSGCDRDAVAAAARVLARGGIVVYPTETFYALGADAGNAAALQRLVALKVRQKGKPIAVLVSDVDMVRDLATEIPPRAENLMRRFWPGPLTLVLRARTDVAPVLTGEGGGIGVRLSSHPVATALVRALGHPVTTPSANPAGMPPPTLVAQAEAYFGGNVDCYLDGGRLQGEPASTVVDMRHGLNVVRAGAVAVREISAALSNQKSNPHPQSPDPASSSENGSV
jgi:L-threonylcarbamoyladenylate synthase